MNDRDRWGPWLQEQSRRNRCGHPYCHDPDCAKTPAPNQPSLFDELDQPTARPVPVRNAREWL